MIRFILLLLVLGSSFQPCWSQENTHRYPLLISRSELRVIVRTIEVTTFYFEVCEIPEGALTRTNSELMEHLSRSPLSCLRINNAVFAVANERDLERLDRIFIREFANTLKLEMVARGLYATGNQAVAILNYVYAYASFAAKSPRFGYLSLASGLVFQGFMARESYKTYQAWLGLHPAPVEVTLQRLNLNKGPLAASVTFDAFIEALDSSSRALYLELHPAFKLNPSLLNRDAK